MPRHRGARSGASVERPDATLALRRYLGNAGVQRAAAPRIQRCSCGGTCPDCAGREEESRLQTKLTVGPPGDRYEREADRVAEQVMRMPDAGADVTTQPGPSIQRLPADAGGVSVHAALPMGGARPLSAQTRAFMEPRLGMDFGGVRLHTGAAAERAAAGLNARAFTVGRDVWLGRGASESDRRLMAHELTHVVQQGGTAAPRTVQRQAGPTPPPSSPPTPSLGGLSEEMVRQIARALRNAMSGPGTDEDAIYAAFAGRTQEQVDAVERVYNAMFERSLSADLQDELTESELRQLAVFGAASAATVAAGGVAATSGGTTVTPVVLAEMVAERLHRAMDRVGTDEAALFAALTGRTVDERREIAAAYERIAGHSLEHALRDELSGTDLTRALRLLHQGLLEPADELYLAMRGAGTDEDTVFRVLDALAGDEPAIRAMEASYRSKYGDLVTHLRDDLSSGEYQRAIAVLGPVIQDADFQDCTVTQLDTLRRRMPLVGQKINRALGVLGGGLAGMSTTERTTFDQYFDPGGNGGIDQGFVDDVVSNFRTLRSAFDAGLTFECEGPGGLCAVSGRYAYTYFADLHICPHFFTMSASDQSWGILHELTHNALWAVDRAYGHEPGFMDLTPRGSWANQIPVFGPLIRLIARDDTLYNPDSYALFAFNV